VRIFTETNNFLNDKHLGGIFMRKLGNQPSVKMSGNVYHEKKDLLRDYSYRCTRFPKPSKNAPPRRDDE